MLSVPGSLKIFVATAAVDFRKSHDGLAAIEELHAAREERSLPILAEFKTWLDLQREKLLLKVTVQPTAPSSHTAAALRPLELLVVLLA